MNELTACEQILAKWDKFKEKHKSGYDKKNKLGGYAWSGCSCTKLSDVRLRFRDNIYADCHSGERYINMRYVVTVEIDTSNWKYDARLDFAPAASDCEEFDCGGWYTGKGYFSLIRDLGKLESGEEYQKFGPDSMGIPYYMSGYVKFRNILRDLSDVYKRGEDGFSLQDICEDLYAMMENDANLYNESHMEVKCDCFAGLYGVYDEALTESTQKSGRINICRADCYVGFRPSNGTWVIDRNLNKSTHVHEEGEGIDGLVKYVSKYMRNSTCIDHFINKIKFYKPDLENLYRQEAAQEG